MENIQIPLQVIDEARCRNNIRQMQQKALLGGSVLRPHFKTHQSEQVGRWFREEGIDRIAVSSISMALQFAADGWQDILIAFPVNLREISQVNQLARSLRLGLLVSCQGVVSLLDKSLEAPVDLYFKVDVGTHRTGFDPDDLPAMEAELACLKDHPLMRFRGFLAHAGHTYQARSHHEIMDIYEAGTGILKELKQHFSPSFEGLLISWGDTPSCSVRDSFEGIDEIRPGNFVFYDLMQWKLGVCSFNQIGMVAAAPVVAVHPSRNEAVVYAGAVHLSKEQLLLNGQPCYGLMVFMHADGRWELPEVQVPVVRISQEHGILKLPPHMSRVLKVGQLTGIIPVHSCLTADLLPARYFV